MDSFQSTCNECDDCFSGNFDECHQKRKTNSKNTLVQPPCECESCDFCFEKIEEAYWVKKAAEMDADSINSNDDDFSSEDDYDPTDYCEHGQCYCGSGSSCPVIRELQDKNYK